VVVDPDGGTGVVEALFPQGEKDIYRVTISGGASAECCEEHLWLVHEGHAHQPESETKVVALAAMRRALSEGAPLWLPLLAWEGEQLWKRVLSIEPVGRKPAQCIRVSTKRHLYVTDGYLVTHNTISTLTFLTRPEVRPAIVVAPKDLIPQWMAQTAKFVPGLTTREAKTGNPEELLRPYRGKVRPLPDVLFITYHKLKGWVSALIAAGFRSIVAEEAHELRTGPDSEKWVAFKEVSEAMSFGLALTATPVFNYGGQAYWILDAIKPGCLGTPEEFAREWCSGFSLSNKARVTDGRAFGAYLRNEGLMLRRTVRELGMSLPKVTSNIYPVDSDLQYIQDAEDKAAELARIVLAQQGFSSTQKLQASGELDARLRKATGIAKAPFVADFVRMLVESGDGRPEPVVLTGHHHEVYAIWEERLRDLRPVFWTGRESRAQKQEALKRFQNREAHVFVLANRAGAGLDGLQHVCNTLVHGELDWAIGVMLQLRGRVDRDGQLFPVMVHTPISNAGCDPIMADVLGLKALQLETINNPGEGEVKEIHTDPDHIKKVAKAILERRGKALAEVA
jgi:hypothetical protein